MQQSNFEHTRILKDFALNNLNDSLKQAVSEVVCDASKICILIKLSDVENKISCRSQTCENICFKINETVWQDNILLIFFDHLYKESKQWAVTTQALLNKKFWQYYVMKVTKIKLLTQIYHCYQIDKDKWINKNLLELLELSNKQNKQIDENLSELFRLSKQITHVYKH